MGDDSGEKFSQFVLSVLKYPETNKRLDGRVYAQFVIDTIGNITDIKILKSLRADYDQALIDAIKQSPRWTPATLEKNAVPYKMVYPIFFSKK
jgi:TonB family protein